MLIAADITAREVEDLDWIEISTPNFSIVGPLGRNEGRDLALHLEKVRAFAMRYMGFSDAGPLVPTLICIMPRTVYRRLVEAENTSGIYMPGIRRNLILVRNHRLSNKWTVQHEYIHDLVSSRDSFDYPRWYVEGLAEYFEGSRTRLDTFYVGLALNSRTHRLLSRSMLPAEKFLTVRDLSRLDEDDFYMYYAQAWLLVHYLFHGEDHEIELHSAFEAYAEQRGAGASEPHAFSFAFGIPPDDLINRLHRYLHGKFLRSPGVRSEELVPDFDPSIRALSRAEAALNLAWVSSRFPQPVDDTQRWLDVALAEPATRARALLISASLKLAGQEIEQVEALLDEAARLEPGNPDTYLNVAAYRLAAARVAPDPERRVAHLNLADSSLVKAWELDPSIPEIYVLAGQSYLERGEQPERAVEMLENARVLLPSNLEVRLLLASAHAASGDHDQALDLAHSVLRQLDASDPDRTAVLEFIDSARSKKSSRADQASDSSS
ncbi:MAG: DUF1570 domain-containing protein [Woeseiaceae bacterium]|nr:DUF1570 domain-containing protein [Woeseiaceae bacterium]